MLEWIEYYSPVTISLEEVVQASAGQNQNSWLLQLVQCTECPVPRRCPFHALAVLARQP